MKPGYKTTEFWTALITQILGALTLLGLLSPPEGQMIEEALGKCVTASFALLIHGVVVVQYIRTRLALKSKDPGHETGCFAEFSWYPVAWSNTPFPGASGHELSF